MVIYTITIKIFLPIDFLLHLGGASPVSLSAWRTHSSRPRIGRIASVNSARCTSIAWSANTRWRTRRGRAKGPRGRRGPAEGAEVGMGWWEFVAPCDLENCHSLFMVNVFLINQHAKWPFSIGNCWSYQRASDHNGTNKNEGGTNRNDSRMMYETLQTEGIFGYASKLWNGFDLLSKSLTGDPSLKNATTHSEVQWFQGKSTGNHWTLTHWPSKSWDPYGFTVSHPSLRLLRVSRQKTTQHPTAKATCLIPQIDHFISPWLQISISPIPFTENCLDGLDMFASSWNHQPCGKRRHFHSITLQ